MRKPLPILTEGNYESSCAFVHFVVANLIVAFKLFPCEYTNADCDRLPHGADYAVSLNGPKSLYVPHGILSV